MQESSIQLEKNSKISQTGRIYLDGLFDPGEFIYLDNSGKWPKYRKAVEGCCDFFVTARGTNYIEVSKAGFITISQYSSLKYLDRVLGTVYLDSNGRITKNKTKTPIGYIDKGTFHINVGASYISNAVLVYEATWNPSTTPATLITTGPFTGYYQYIVTHSLGINNTDTILVNKANGEELIVNTFNAATLNTAFITYGSTSAITIRMTAAGWAAISALTAITIRIRGF